MNEDQSHNNIDQHAPDVSTRHRNRTGLPENEQKDNTDYGPLLNPDVLENVIKTTVGRYPQMRQILRAVSRFFKHVVDTLPLPRVYIPELVEVANIRHLSVWKIINMKGKNSGAVIALRNIINAKNWSNAWVSLVAYGYGWYGISKIYWRTRN